MQSYFGVFYFGKFKPNSSNTWVMPIRVGTVSIFTPFNFAILLSSRNSRNKGHTNTEGWLIDWLMWVTLHTAMHHSSTSTYVPNFIEIEETFCMLFSRCQYCGALNTAVSAGSRGTSPHRGWACAQWLIRLWDLSIAGCGDESSRLAGVVRGVLFAASRVLAQMSRQVSGARVLLVADRALVGPLARVRQHVFTQVARRRVPMSARRTRMRRLVRMNVHVSFHRTWLRKPFLADAALVPAFSRVHLQTQCYFRHGSF